MKNVLSYIVLMLFLVLTIINSNAVDYDNWSNLSSTTAKGQIEALSGGTIPSLNISKESFSIPTTRQPVNSDYNRESSDKDDRSYVSVPSAYEIGLRKKRKRREEYVRRGRRTRAADYTLARLARKKFKAVKYKYNEADEKYYFADKRGFIVLILEKDISGRFTRLNSNKNILAHLNRNFYNKLAYGDLARLDDNLFVDERGCVFDMTPYILSLSHKPSEYIKFTRKVSNSSQPIIRPRTRDEVYRSNHSRMPSEKMQYNRNSSHETIRELRGGEIRTSHLFEGKNVTSGYGQGTFNYTSYKESALGHYTSDMEFHYMDTFARIFDGYTEYATFPPSYDQPTKEEKLRVLKKVFPQKYENHRYYKKKMKGDFESALNKIFDEARKKEEHGKVIRKMMAEQGRDFN